MNNYYVYILTNKLNSVFYIGVTNNLLRRIFEHKTKKIKGFTSKYNVNKLIYLEHCNNALDAINREKNLKNWHRDWKINLIKETNPNFNDLSDEWEELKEMLKQVQHDK